MSVQPVEEADPTAEMAWTGLDLLKELHTPIWLLGASGTVLWLNASARALVHVSADALPATIAAGLSDDVLAALAAIPLGRSLSGSVTFRGDLGETVVLCKLSRVDGRRYGYPSRVPILAEAVVDAPARREVLRLTEQLAALSDAFPDYRLVLHRDGTILSAVSAQTGDGGMAPERLRDKAAHEVLPPQAMETLLAGVRRLNGAGGVTPLDYSLDTADGPRHFEGRLVALPDGVRVMAIMRDVTERRRAETVAIAARNMLMDAIESISEGFVVFDARERLVLCNSKFRDLYRASAAALVPGSTLEDMLRVGVLNGQYDLDEVDPGAWLAEQLALHRVSGAPFELRLGDGRWVRIKDWRTSEGGLVGIRTDITERKLREAELQRARDEADRANRRKSDFIHHLSHELRTPIASILGFADLLGDACAPEPEGASGTPESMGRHLAEIRAAGGYMLNLVNGLLDLARIEAGHMAIEDSACDLVLMAEMTIRMLEGRAAARGMALSLVPLGEESLGEGDEGGARGISGRTCGAGRAVVRGDMSMIRQMLTNIIGNAIKYARPDGGRVDIDLVAVERGGLAVRVRDNGPGMSDEEVVVALSLFGQVRRQGAAGMEPAAAGSVASAGGAGPGGDAKDRGTGLGLPLTKSMIELHGGRLAIDSQPGTGTLVSLVFPADRVLSSSVDGAGG